MPLPPAISSQIDFGDVDFSVAGFIQTDQGGAIISKTIPGKPFLPNSKTLYVDPEGKLVFEVGLVNKVQSKSKVNDGEWHEFGLVHSAAEDRLVILPIVYLSSPGMVTLLPTGNGNKELWLVMTAYRQVNYPCIPAETE